MVIIEKFIQNFAKLAKPLTLLLRKNVPFVWQAQQQEAFETFKRILTTAPILQYPKFDERFILTTDASDYAIGAVLSQGEIGKDLPIQYLSRNLSKSEISYSTTQKELLAIVWSVKKLRHYLYGRRFLILKDHRALTWLFRCKDGNSRLMRWRLELEEYNYEIQFKPGRINSNADALSPNPVLSTQLNNKETYELLGITMKIKNYHILRN